MWFFYKAFDVHPLHAAAVDDGFVAYRTVTEAIQAAAVFCKSLTEAEAETVVISVVAVDSVMPIGDGDVENADDTEFPVTWYGTFHASMIRNQQA